MTIEERAHNFATDYAPFSDHTNLEIGYVKGAEEQKQIDIGRIVKFLSKEIGGELNLFRNEKEFKAFTCHLIQAMEE